MQVHLHAVSPPTSFSSCTEGEELRWQYSLWQAQT